MTKEYEIEVKNMTDIELINECFSKGFKLERCTDRATLEDFLIGKERAKYPEFKMKSFKEFDVGDFFYSNGYLCIKIDDEKFIKSMPNRGECKIVEWDKSCFETANAVDVTYSYRVIKKVS